MTKFVDGLSANGNVVFTLFNSPLALTKFARSGSCAAVVVAYDDSRMAREVSAQMVMGGLPFLGRLPMDVGGIYREGSGITTKPFILD
jgi:hypothetical protein